MSTATTNVSAAAVVAVPSAGSASIDLDKITRTHTGKLLVTFARFQAAVADALGLWIEHSSQQSRRARDRAEEWQYEVSAAFERGAK
jgi:archaellin